jgi:hypothetical protein
VPDENIHRRQVVLRNNGEEIQEAPWVASLSRAVLSPKQIHHLKDLLASPDCQQFCPDYEQDDDQIFVA